MTIKEITVGGTCNNDVVVSDRVSGVPRKNSLLALLDGVYALVSHTHDGVYALVSHTHDGVYSPIDHTHDGLGGTVPCDLQISSAGAISVYAGTVRSMTGKIWNLIDGSISIDGLATLSHYQVYFGRISGIFSYTVTSAGFDGDDYAIVPCVAFKHATGNSIYVGKTRRNMFLYVAQIRQSVADDLKFSGTLTIGTTLGYTYFGVKATKVLLWMYASTNVWLSCTDGVLDCEYEAGRQVSMLPHPAMFKWFASNSAVQIAAVGFDFAE